MEEAARARAGAAEQAPQAVAVVRAPDVVRAGVAAAGVALALASTAWIVPSAWPTYAVFFVLAFAFSFVWLDSDAPTSVPYMAMATAFVYIAGFPILFFEKLARLFAYPVMFFAARQGVVALPRPLRPLAQPDRARSFSALLGLAAMLGIATIGLAVRVGVIHVARAAGVGLPGMVVLGEPVAYAVMGALSAWLPVPTGEYVVAAPHRLPAEDERVDVIFTAVVIVPILVVVIVQLGRSRSRRRGGVVARRAAPALARPAAHSSPAPAR